MTASMTPPASHRVLVLFAHPALQRSRVHRRLVPAVRDLEGVTFHDLYEAYADFDVDVAREQDLLVGHDLIVVQHPLYWYSVPPLLKQWMDLVLQHGWAYGQAGTALRGKLWLEAITTGGTEATYQPSGAEGATILQLLAPIARTARLCGMDFLPPFVVHGTLSMGEPEIAAAAADYRRTIAALRDRHVDLGTVRTLPRLNADLGALLGG